MLDDPVLYQRLRLLEQRVEALEKTIDELKKEVELDDSEQRDVDSYENRWHGEIYRRFCEQ